MQIAEVTARRSVMRSHRHANDAYVSRRVAARSRGAGRAQLQSALSCRAAGGAPAITERGQLPWPLRVGQVPCVDDRQS